MAKTYRIVLPTEALVESGSIRNKVLEALRINSNVELDVFTSEITIKIAQDMSGYTRTRLITLNELIAGLSNHTIIERFNKVPADKPIRDYAYFNNTFYTVDLYHAGYPSDKEYINANPSSMKTLTIGDIADIVLATTPTNLINLGSTVFFKMLKESGARGKLCFSITPSQLGVCVFTELKDYVSPLSELPTATEFIRSLSSYAEELAKSKDDIEKNLIIRAETERTDYRSKTNPTVFKVKLYKKYKDREDVESKYEKKILFTDAILNDFATYDKTLAKLSKSSINNLLDSKEDDNYTIQGF